VIDKPLETVVKAVCIALKIIGAHLIHDDQHRHAWSRIPGAGALRVPRHNGRGDD
jgi:hypothetical protein